MILNVRLAPRCTDRTVKHFPGVIPLNPVLMEEGRQKKEGEKEMEKGRRERKDSGRESGETGSKVGVPLTIYFYFPKTSRSTKPPLPAPGETE